MTPQKSCNTHRRKSGFTLVEVCLSLIVFLCMTLMFAAIVPTILRNAKMANDYTQAHLVAQHKIEQVRGSGFNNLTLSSMQGRNVIDSTQPSGYPVSNPTGFASGATSYSFATVDNLSSYFPSGSTGVLTIAPDLAAPSGMCDDIYVTISWTSAGGIHSSFRANTKVANL